MDTRPAAPEQLDGFCVFGASGHGLTIATYLQRHFGALGVGRLAAFVDDERGGRDEMLQGVPIVSCEEWRARLRHLLCVVGIGSPSKKRAVAERLAAAGARFENIYDRLPEDTHPHVVFDVGAFVAWGIFIGPMTVVGRHVQVLPNCSVGHDVSIGDYSTICPSCTISGYVNIGPEVFLGAGTIIVNGRSDRRLRIGAGAVLAAGSVVTKDVPAGESWCGNPARPLRALALARRMRDAHDTVAS